MGNDAPYLVVFLMLTNSFLWSFFDATGQQQLMYFMQDTQEWEIV